MHILKRNRRVVAGDLGGQGQNMAQNEQHNLMFVIQVTKGT